MIRTPNREERRLFACMRHTPPVPILKVIITAPLSTLQAQETRIDLGKWQPDEHGQPESTMLCAVCHRPPLLEEVQEPEAPRQPKMPSLVWTPPGTRSPGGRN